MIFLDIEVEWLFGSVILLFSIHLGQFCPLILQFCFSAFFSHSSWRTPITCLLLYFLTAPWCSFYFKKFSSLFSLCIVSVIFLNSPTFSPSLSNLLLIFSSVQLLSRVWLFATPWTAACQASLSITNSRSLLKLMSIELVMPSNHLIFCGLLLLLLILSSVYFTLDITYFISRSLILVF